MFLLFAFCCVCVCVGGVVNGRMQMGGEAEIGLQILSS
jgi:hypothetical protein